MDKENAAALLIQRNWRRFYIDRKLDVHNLLGLLASMGSKIANIEELHRIYMDGNNVIVRANESLFQPTIDHAFFIYKYKKYHLMLYKKEHKKYHEDQGNSTSNGTSLVPEYKGNGKMGSMIAEEEYAQHELSKDYAKHLYLIGRGVFYVLDSKYSQYFLMAFAIEKACLKLRPYHYGLHYNCNRFTKDVLERLKFLA